LNESLSGKIGRIGSPGGQIAASAILGGTTSSLVGGKFANGAITAAFATAFNRLAHQSGSAGPSQDDIVVGFRGAGSADLPDNQAISEFAGDIGAKLFDASAIVGAPLDDALAYVQGGLDTNPSARVFIFGYSAGGQAAISLAEILDGRGIPVAGLVTFDPHHHLRLLGYGTYQLPRNVGGALNLYQHNNLILGSNPFLGGVVHCSGCASNPNINLTGTSVVHTNIVQYGLQNYDAQIRSTLGR